MISHRSRVVKQNLQKSDIFQHFFGFSSCITSADRPSIGTKPNDVLAELFALFDAVMAWCAEALEVVWVKEQRLIAFMWPDMVTHRCWRDVLLLQAIGAQRMRGQLSLT